MTNKELLKNITPKDLDLSGDVLLMLDGSVLMSFEDYYWLIKQAKRVHELEQKNKRYREALELIREQGSWGLFTDKYARIAQKALEGEEIE